MRLPDRVAASDGCWTDGNRAWTLRKMLPVETELKGKNLLFIAGGIGLAPLRSVINYCRHYRDNYGTIDIIYGSRSKDDLVDYEEIQEEWCKEAGINVHLTIDREQEGWDGHVGFVPNYVKEVNLTSVRPF